MTDAIIESLFAPAERNQTSEIIAIHDKFVENKLLCNILDSIPDIIFILNGARQVIYTNKVLYSALGYGSFNDIKTLRPGEILKCINADKCKGGCGTSEYCTECGAVNAILAAQKGLSDVRECRVTQKDTGESFDFRVWSSPIIFDGEKFVVLTVKDISDEKRRQVLEKIFFHDILNIASNFTYVMEIIKDLPQGQIESYVEILRTNSSKLVDEIRSQRELVSAENNELPVDPSPVESIQVLDDITSMYNKSEFAEERFIKTDKNTDAFEIVTDLTLLRRVAGNMLKNALEASHPGETITVGAKKLGENEYEFRVHNPGVMPRTVQMQVFQRSFSTKGAGRGLGTYSIKLLTERYLKGKASFSSNEKDGTAFRVVLPKAIKSNVD
jgi:nitrogen fixation/metabolism regulation signal transduction histidine kinase